MFRPLYLRAAHAGLVLLAAGAGAAAYDVADTAAPEPPEHLFVVADEPAAVIELPAPAPRLPGGVAGELERLQRQIDELRAAQDRAADGGTPARAASAGKEKGSQESGAKEKAGKEAAGKQNAGKEKGGGSADDRLAAVEKGLGKLVAAADRKKADDAKKPSLVVSGQVQADQVYFGQDAVGRASVGDLQDGSQFRRLRIGARGTTFEVLDRKSVV